MFLFTDDNDNEERVNIDELYDKNNLILKNKIKAKQ